MQEDDRRGIYQLCRAELAVRVPHIPHTEVLGLDICRVRHGILLLPLIEVRMDRHRIGATKGLG